MFFAFRHGLMVIACGAVLTGVARADNDATVSDGPARGELFEMRVRADLGPNIKALSTALAQQFLIPTHILGDAVYGVAVSRHNDENCVCKAGQRCNQCKIDWGRVENLKIAFVYVKATQGARYKDPTFEYHWRSLAQQRLHRGAVHFMSADEDPVEQADHFVNQLEAAGKLTASDLPPCLDLESDYRKDAAKKWIVAESGEKLDFWKGQEPEEILGKILRWLNRVEQRTGRIPMIYTSRGWWRDRIKDETKFALLKRYPLWIANFPETGRVAHDAPKVPNNQPWTIWHFTENGRFDEPNVLPGLVDVAQFKGTLAGFRRAFNVSAPEIKIARNEEASEPSKSAQQLAAISQSQANDASQQNGQEDSAAPQPAAAAITPPQQAASIAPAQRAEQAAPQSAPAAGANQAAANRPVPQAAAAEPSQAANSPAQQPTQQASPPQPATAAATLARQSTPSHQSAAQPAQQSAARQEPRQDDKAAQASQQGAPVAQAQPQQQAQQVAQAEPPQQQTQQQTQQVAARQPPQQAPGAPVQAAESKPAQQGSTPTQAASANAAAQSAPSSQSAAGKAPQAASTVPPQNTSKAPEQTASIPAVSVAAVNPNEQKAVAGEKAGSAAKNAEPPNSGGRAPASQSAAGNPPQRTAEKAPAEPNAAADKIMIEIELRNGRKLRVDANIDPAVLARLIAAIEK